MGKHDMNNASNSELSSRVKDQANIAEDRGDHRGATLLRLAASRLNPPEPPFEPPPLDAGPPGRCPKCGGSHNVGNPCPTPHLADNRDAGFAEFVTRQTESYADPAMLRSVTEGDCEAARVRLLESIVRDLVALYTPPTADPTALDRLKARARAALVTSVRPDPVESVVRDLADITIGSERDKVDDLIRKARALTDGYSA